MQLYLSRCRRASINCDSLKSSNNGSYEWHLQVLVGRNRGREVLGQQKNRLQKGDVVAANVLVSGDT